MKRNNYSFRKKTLGKRKSKFTHVKFQILAKSDDKDSSLDPFKFNNCSYRKGNNPKTKTTIVLSAPGSSEEKNNRPAAGQTGKTLNNSLKQLNKKNPKDFPSTDLDDYTIMNASEKIHYKKKTNSSEEKDSNIKKKSNIDRINEQLEGSEVVVALGRKAKIAVENSNYDGKIYSANHPSMQSLNRKYKSNKKKQSERSNERIEKWSNDLLISENFQFIKKFFEK